MMFPSVFGENLFDDWMDDFGFRDNFFSGKNPLYGKHAKNIMKTDVRETDKGYELDVDLPGFKKDEVQVQLKDGYLTISAAKGLDKDEEDKGTVELKECRGDFIFDHVSLRYPNADRDAVHDFNLELKAGDCVALVGLSGSGKSTLVHMIPRFWNPTEGRILIDGIDAQNLTLESLRRHIAIVSQDVILFDDTIRNNIMYGTPDATEGQVWKAVEAAALTDFIHSLPQGLDTPVGEAGSLLSGGQKQRVSIARAFLRNTPILILDEATSALDSESEEKIKDALLTLMKGRTTFMVAHRFATIEHANLIVSMADGEVKEMGTREELLQRNGLYTELSRLQLLDTKGNKKTNNSTDNEATV